MKFSKWLAAVLVWVSVIALLAVGVVSGCKPAIEATKLTFSNPVPASSEQGWTKTMKPWAERVAQRTGGKCEVEAYHGGSLVSFIEMPKGVGAGVADIGHMSSDYHPAEFPMEGLGAILHPGVRLDALQTTIIGRIIHEEIPAFKEDYTKNNVMKLFTASAAGWNLISTVPIDKLEDLKGMKVRTFGVYGPRVFSAIGAATVSIPYGEVLDALHKKVVDCTFTTYPNARDESFDEVAPHLISLGINLMGNTGVVIINLDTWNRLSPELQRIMLEEAKRIEYEWAVYTVEEDSKAAQEMVARGATMHKISNDEMGEWAELCPDFFSELRAELDAAGLPGTQTINRFEELIAMPRAELEALWEQVWEKKIASVK